MTPFFALADDLTGALEVGAKFAGAAVTTRLDWPRDTAAPVIDTETRHSAAGEAAAIVRRLACQARELGARFVYKKTDSTLRGNIGAELSALAAAFPGSRVVYVPAYPQMGRTVVDGCLFVDGVPAHLTEYARDPLNPVRDSRVPAPECVDVWDAETDADVSRAADALLRAKGTILAAGPAAFVEALARGMAAPRGPEAAFPKVRRCLVVNGSLHPLSARQAAAMASDEEWMVWEQGGPGIGRKVREAVDRFDALFIFGGDTAFEVLEALGCTVVRPRGEIVPGVPLSVLDVEGRELVFITKAGGFGPVDILASVRRGADDRFVSSALVERPQGQTTKNDGLPHIYGITMGDSSGIGPEVLLHCVRDGALRLPVVAFGDLEALAYYNDLLGYGVELRKIASAADYTPGPLNVIDLGILRRADVTPGKLSRQSGHAAREYVVAATRAALAKEIAAIVTLPMNKEATQLSDPAFVGHTELIGHLCGVEDVTIMLASEQLIVTHVTTHVSLKTAIERAKKERICTILRLTSDAVCRLLPNARIAVAGLNPHAGENGLFGDEEIREIRPAVEWAQSQGMPVEGPFPPDTVFYMAVRKKKFDAIVCMYHDQGHVPLKLLDFEGGVNVALGLPIIRTSVDHGTAFDIAGQGVASTVSLVKALDFAAKLASW